MVTIKWRSILLSTTELTLFAAIIATASVQAWIAATLLSIAAFAVTYLDGKHGWSL